MQLLALRESHVIFLYCCFLFWWNNKLSNSLVSDFIARRSENWRAAYSSSSESWSANYPVRHASPANLIIIIKFIGWLTTILSKSYHYNFEIYEITWLELLTRKTLALETISSFVICSCVSRFISEVNEIIYRRFTYKSMHRQRGHKYRSIMNKQTMVTTQSRIL